MGSPLAIEGPALLGKPPIIDEEDGSIFLAPYSYLKGDSFRDFGSRMEEGVCFLLDLLSNSFDEQIMLGSGVTDGTAFRIRLHADGIPNRVEMMLRDDD